MAPTSQRDPQVDIAVQRRAACGEGPLWDPSTAAVHWVDIINGEILTTDYDTLQTSTIDYPEMVGAAAPRHNSGFVAAVATGFVGISRTGEVTERVDCLPGDVRMNDAKVDPRGRYWAGSCAYDFADGRGGLWRLDQDWNVELVISGLTQPNGLGWSPDGASFYLVETQARQLLRFDADIESGTLPTNPAVLIEGDAFPPGLPDGLAVDEQGHLWIAMFGGSAVHEYSPRGELLRTVPIPTEQATSCMFVGPDRNELWVTSAAAGISPQADPDAGSTFRVRGLGATGMPVPAFGG